MQPGPMWTSMIAAVVVAGAAIAGGQDTPPVQPVVDTMKADGVAQPLSSPLDAIIAPDAKPIAIVTGRKFCEGPVWVPLFKSVDSTQGEMSGGFLLFSDIPANTVLKWSPEHAPAFAISAREPEVFLEPSGHSNGLTIAPNALHGDKSPKSEGTTSRPPLWVFLAQHAGKISTMPISGSTLTLLAEKFEGKSLSSPNDLVIKSDGSIYFTDPPYGVRGSLGPGGRQKELDFSGIFRLAPDGSLVLLNKTMPTPNGLAFSADEKTLYVADTSKGEIRTFSVNADGSLDEGRLFAQLRVKNDKGDERPAGGDGVKVDARGNVYCAARGGVWVFSQGGDKIGVIALPSSPTNLCFGGPDMKTLFMTTATSVYAVPLKVEGRR